MAIAQLGHSIGKKDEIARLQIRNKELRFGTRTFVMGIVNATPDSFSGDGILDVDAAVERARQQISDGADIIDVGGQSTRPGYEAIDEQSECARVVPIIAKLRQVSDVIISVDTFVAAVLEKAVQAGADILNSVYGVNDSLLEVIAKRQIPLVITHNKPEATYANGVVAEVREELSLQAQRALKAGLRREQVILDPGIGFGKTADQNLEILSHFSAFTELGFPTLIGTSRKSTIGKVTGRPIDQRAYGTAATIALAIAHGVDIVRVHDVAQMMDVVKMSDGIVRNWRPHDWGQVTP
jgi:dihydropteroate synthase